ncbi:hypothetical protein [Actinoplanes sp. TFC3]|uniref:hypothetical protein n=1 Tax=Actinoplanes sp. TFC3 TaxID=1710355 RepID=UPI00082B44FE|nr:hypothetical protein [Actinoplanes sp. TFC3]
MSIVCTNSPASYPLADRALENLFTDEVTHAVADLLQSHGFPLIADGPDLERLRAHLSGYLFGRIAA